jgi:hypothetical protein
MFWEFRMMRHVPVEDEMLRFSNVILLLPSITIGPVAVSEVGGLEVVVADRAGVVVATGLGVTVAACGVVVALGVLVGLMVGVAVDGVVVGLGAPDIALAAEDATLNVAASERVRPLASFITAIIWCNPGASVDESRGLGRPSGSVPPKSKGECQSVYCCVFAVLGSRVNITRLIVDSPGSTNIYIEPIRVASLRAWAPAWLASVLTRRRGEVPAVAGFLVSNAVPATDVVRMIVASIAVRMIVADTPGFWRCWRNRPRRRRELSLPFLADR